jgi:uncharacterized FlaG/YvyC family protein
MASEGIPVNIPGVLAPGGNSLPPRGETPPPAAGSQPARASEKSDFPALVTRLNRQLNDSGRPDEFRLDSSAGRVVIQQINPASGAVIAEYPEAEFPGLAAGLSGAGFLIDTKV